MELKRLDDVYKGKKTLFQYETKHYYDIERRLEEEHIFFLLEKKPFDKVIYKEFDAVLLETNFDNPALFGMLEDDKLVGFIEIASDINQDRMRITNLLVANDYRRQSIGTRLIEKAIDFSMENKMRAIVLEVQSCNVPAIEFFMTCGFDIIGFDIMAYSNHDADNKDFLIEMGMEIKRRVKNENKTNFSNNTNFITF